MTRQAACDGIMDEESFCHETCSCRLTNGIRNEAKHQRLGQQLLIMWVLEILRDLSSDGEE